MKRRDYLKSIFIIGGVSLTAVPAFKWFKINRQVAAKQIADKRAIIAALAELIIPRTDTPGAMDAGVQDYVINVMINCASVKEKNKFLSGLQDIEDYSADQFGKDFMSCTPGEKSAALKYIAGHARFSSPLLNKINDKFLGTPFYPKFKALVVEGFCMSEPGATQALAYDYIPGSYEASIPIQPHQKSWATK